MKKVCGFAIVVVAVLLLVEVIPKAESIMTCSPVELSPCLDAITSSSAPSSTCCQKLKEQKPCLCDYLENPTFSQYINSTGAKRVSSACGVPFPTC
ncbi:hypothetical protein Fmac_016974 [Flemingia macrophylla]|uniref:Bifunctional inhibitor/plant lipid transfer protein/seed storage helical domain-containing protein n=1 Tax=Flemingia macrophylla TaxID=520843 RepID=A0ABD1MJ70_9FABA